MAATFVIANFISDITGLIKKGIKELTGEAKIERELKKIEKANKNLKKSIDDLSESESKLANVESEISRINDEITSIQSKGKLTLTDEGDIERLSRQSSLLQSQQRILENNVRLQRESAAFNAKNVLDTGYTGKTYEVSGKSKVVSSGEENYSYGDWAKYYENAFITQSYNGYLDALSSGDEAKQKLYKEAVDKNSAEITQYISSLYEILQSFQDSEGNIISGYEDLYEEYTEMISNLQSLIDPNSFNQFLMDWSKDEKLNYNFEEGFNDVLEDMYGMEDFDFNKLRSMNEEFFDKLAEQGISDSTISAILNYKKSIYESVLQTINDTYNVKDIPELKTSYLDNPNETGTHLRTEDGAKVYTGVETELDRERQKLIDWGLEQYEDQIDSGILHIFGNVDMDKRAIITWSEELKETYKNELASWNYDPEIGSIDTVFGGYDEFGWGGKQHEIAFTPILQTEDGKAVLLSSDEVFKYIESVIDKAGEDGVITADEILKIDATETGKQFGQQFGKGLIAGIDESEGMTAEEVGKLMHFSGKYGAWNLAKYPTDVDYGQSDEMKKLQEATDQAKSSHDSLTKYVKKHPLETGLENLPEQYKHLKDLMGKNWSDDFLDYFTPEERQLALGIEIDDEDYDYATLKEKLQAKISPIEVEVKPKASDAVDSMADMQTALESLSDLYGQTVTQDLGDKLATIAADPAMLNSIESAFAKFSEKLKAEGNDAAVNEINEALSNFQKVAVESYGDPDYANKMQDAIDQLITSYIDETDVIKNLTEENKEWSIEQLEAKGITNAEQVVIDRLTKTQKVSAKAWSQLTDAIDAYNDALSRNDTATAEKQIESLTKSLNEMVGDDTGITFDTEFVKENIALIEDFINEVEGAREKLQTLASQNYIAHLQLEGDNTNLDYYRNQLIDLIGQFDGSQIQIGASLDNHPVIRAFIEMAEQAGLTARDIQKSLAAAGVHANIKTRFVPVANINSITKAQQQAAYNARGIQGVRDLMTQKVEVLEDLTYEPASKVQTASYSRPSTLGSSSGGGGGGGGSEPTKPKEESEESFDWIEVAIQRIEEEISRLDKVVNNSYDLWGNRNKALVDELEKTTEEIKAQQLAQSEYLRNANLVQVNNGKGLNEDDYGENDSLVKENDQRLLDEARAAWATGEYQRKVREGQMSGDDIEKIQNHFLTETIQTYQELFNKSVQAGDAVQDLKIKLGDLAKTRFDNVKTEIDELIAYVTSAADIIDDKIDRTEKHGYFVSKSYYQDLKKLESNQYDYLMQEYEGLIQKRDEAVAAGYITESSSAWHQMNQEINGVALALEQSKTKMVEYNNQIRQLDWDFFDWVEERISRINSEASFLVDLMSNDQLYEDNGYLTNLGHATNAMYAAQYETYMRQAQDYAKERVKLEAEIAKDPANRDLIARNETLIDQQQEMIKGAEQMKDAVKSLVQEGINKYLSSLQKLIDEFKTALSDSKALYDYQKNISQQTKNIASLRKQLTAYEGDDSEETRATVQRLRKQLDEAETQLKETQWDKYISETEQFLSDMYTEMEDVLNQRLENIDLLMHDMIDIANENSATVRDTIAEETDKVGYTLTSYLDGVLNGGQTQFSVDLNNGFAQVNGLMTNVLAVIEQIKSYAAAMVDNGKSTVENEKATSTKASVVAPASTGKTSTSTTTTTTNTSSSKPNSNGSSGGGNKLNNVLNSSRTETDKYGVALAIINGNYGWGDGDTRVKNLKAKGFDPIEIQNLVNKLWYEGHVFSGSWVGRYHGITDISKYAYGKYAKGSKNISKDQLAWTQEKGQELIFRSSDGAMLTPLNAGDKVFTAQMTDNLWELAKGRFATNVPKSAGGNTINNSNAISITLPNVKNYEEFKTALQNDPKMTSFIQQITLGEVSNGVKLNKKKY